MEQKKAAGVVAFVFARCAGVGALISGRLLESDGAMLSRTDSEIQLQRKVRKVSMEDATEQTLAEHYRLVFDVPVDVAAKRNA